MNKLPFLFNIALCVTAFVIVRSSLKEMKGNPQCSKVGHAHHDTCIQHVLLLSSMSTTTVLTHTNRFMVHLSIAAFNTAYTMQVAWFD
jgi:hypothetical protein